MPAAPLRVLPLLLLLLPRHHGAVGAAEEGGGLSSSSTSSSSSSSSSLSGDNGLTLGTEGTAPGGSAAPAAADAPFSLKVLLRDAVTRQPLQGASVDVYLNHSRSGSARAGPGGEALLFRVPYSPRGPGLTLLGRMEGYVPGSMLWTTSRRPIFSAVTLLLLPHTQGNIWLFDDFVLITAKLPDSSSQPKVKFPKNLLTVPEGSNVSSVTAYLTVPERHLARDCGNCTPGVVSNRSGLRSVELKAAAAVCVMLRSGAEELQVRGPIQISLPLGPDTRLRAADTVPAWALNPETGSWENQGLGIVRTAGDGLVWTYTASHLGYWIAAPLPSSSTDYLGHLSSLDFLSHHSFLLLGVLGGTLAVVGGFLSLLLCHCRGSYREPERRQRRRRRQARFSKLTVVKKDQTTSTHMEEGLLFRSGENSLASCSVQCEPSSTPRHKANYNIYVEDPGGRPGGRPAAPLYENLSSKPPLHYINSEEAARLREKAEQANMDTDFFPDKLVNIYSQQVALIQAPELFGPQDLKSATFPRNGGDPEPASKDGYTQTLPKAQGGGGGGPQQGGGDEPQPLETPPPGQGSSAAVWARYRNLLESSVSVPGTLNEAAGVEGFGGGRGAPGELQGVSERTLLELTRGKSHPRAWFVSLDGKPAAQVRHSIIELQSRHRPPSSNDTSLDSGVDMNEPQQSLREAERDRERDRERPSARAASLPHHRGRCYGEEADLSSSESGTTATCTPEDPYLRNILDGSSGAIPNIPEEGDGMDTSSAQEDSESRGTPPPRRLRKARERGKAEKRSAAKHVREARPLTKRS